MHMWTCPPHVESYSTPSHDLYLYMFLYFLLTAYFVVGMWVPNMKVTS